MIGFLGALVSAAALLFPLFITLNRWKTMRLVQLDNIWQSALWSLRINSLTHPFPTSLERWSFRHMSEVDYLATWEFLRPFFASRGYTLYLKKAGSAELLPGSKPDFPPKSVRCYPYSRIIENDKDFAMLIGVSELSLSALSHTIHNVRAVVQPHLRSTGYTASRLRYQVRSLYSSRA